MSDWQVATITVNGINLHYTRTGGAKPPLVLLHGVLDDGLCWSPIADVLAATYDVIMLDARGHGRSDKPSENYDPSTQANDVYGVIQALQLHKPLLLGHSMGAITTLVFAALYPDVPAAIALEDPPAWWMWTASESAAPNPNEDEQRAAFVAGIRQLVSKNREQLIADEQAVHPNWSDAELQPWADAKLSFGASVIDHIFAPHHHTTVDWRTVLPQVTCPTLLITGDLDHGAILGTPAVDVLKTLVPQVQMVNITNAGHSIRRDQPAAYLAAVQDFFANVRS